MPCLPVLKKSELNEKTLNQIILNILLGFKNIKKRNVSEKKQEIKKNIINMISGININEVFIEELIDSIEGCFKQDEISKIDFEIDFDFQNLIITKSNKKATFQIPKGKGKPVPKYNLKKFQNDDDIWLKDIDSEIIRNATKMKYETINEIECVYPDLKVNNRSMKICDHQFRIHFFGKTENEITLNFPSYKIECWMKADEIMNLKKFID